MRKQELDTMVSEGKSCLHSESFANQFWSVAMIVKMLRLSVITESYPGRHPIIQSILNLNKARVVWDAASNQQLMNCSRSVPVL